MSIKKLLEQASNKNHFTKLSDYVDFSLRYTDYIRSGLQATIVSQNQTDYVFFQHGKSGNFNISRPINSTLLANKSQIKRLLKLVARARDLDKNECPERHLIRAGIYTLQQCIGSCLDALPAGQSNKARKINGDLFERLMRLLIQYCGIDATEGVLKIPIEVEGEQTFSMSYQHDLILKNKDEISAIGSVKTSSKDRIDKIFIDKFLHNKLTGEDTPHFAVFLNDVQRKKTKSEGQYSISQTFLPGHFKGYTIKLNPLDGVFYCDILPRMQGDPLLAKHITTIDRFFSDALPNFQTSQS